MKKRILTILLCGVIVLGFATGCNSKKRPEKDLEETISKYGSVEKETVDVLVAKFNTEVMNNNEKLNPASDDYLTIDNNKYWYGLIEGIYLVVVPKEFSNDKAKDIVDYMFLYIDKGKINKPNVIKYAKYLIKANNNNITTEEVDTLLEEAKQKSQEKKTANNGKGISVGYVENDNNYQYQVIRLYK